MNPTLHSHKHSPSDACGDENADHDGNRSSRISKARAWAAFMLPCFCIRSSRVRRIALRSLSVIFGVVLALAVIDIGVHDYAWIFGCAHRVHAEATLEFAFLVPVGTVGNRHATVMEGDFLLVVEHANHRCIRFSGARIGS
ncbi:hypothetical protein BITS_1525 [Bifidobacterium tsurumiense]|uniref:Uncharacterized protein n=1 Tax=Bifidobacterium tsurumiense TaxID=356829 RepID=A0A087EH48_9BIFI|nr:hypothetical protein BITS_1525 [Bifidobacterium tsurumiense]